MKWTLQSSASNSEFELISADGKKVKFKYSRTQQSIRMRFDENHGVYVLDEGWFGARKFSIRNVYGSEIGTVSKALWKEASGTLLLNDVHEKINYRFNSKVSIVDVREGSMVTDTIAIADGKAEENYMLALIVFSWKQSIATVHTPAEC